MKYFLLVQRNTTEKQAEDRAGTSLASSAQGRLQSHKEPDVDRTVTDDCSSANQADKVGPDDSGSDGSDGQKARPMSPGTLALMCDEQDTIFMAASSPNRLTGHGCNTSSQLPYGQGMTEVYAEQERIVLTKFRDCLNRLITFGEIKGKFLTFFFHYFNKGFLYLVISKNPFQEFSNLSKHLERQ